MHEDRPDRKRTIDRPDRLLVVGFLLIIFVIVLLAGVSLYRTVFLSGQLQLVADSYYYRASLVRTMRVSARERATDLYAALLSDDPFERAERIESIYMRGSDFLHTREVLLQEDLSQTEIDFIERHRELARRFAPDQTRVIELLDQGKVEAARTYMYQVAAPRQAQALSVLDDYFFHLDTLTQEAVLRVRDTARHTVTLLGILATTGILTSLLIAYLVRRRLWHLFTEISAARDQLAIKVAERTRELRSANSRLEQLAHYDDLTELPNRRLFYDSLDAFLSRARRHARFVGVLYIDLDGFKAVNDQLGHEYGDDLLKQVAVRLRSSVRTEDMVARLGGDEFVIVSGDMESAQAIHTIAKKIIDEINAPYVIQGETVRIGCSIGCAIYPVHADQKDALVAAADEAMYDVKKTGKNDYKIYAESTK